MRQQLYAYILTMLCLLFPACDVHEFPEPPVPPVELSLNLKFTFGLGILEDFKTIYFQTRATDDSSLFEARYQLRLHPGDGKGGFLMDSCLRYSLSQSELQALDYQLSLSLVPGRYRCRAWVDFVPEGVGDYFYDTADFNAITLRGSYTGNSDFRDAFRGSADVEVLPAEIQPVQNLELAMERPMAKYRFIATDLKEFEELRLKDSGGDLTATVPPIDLSKYRVRIYYNGFLPAVYNLATDEPVDVQTGVSFEGSMREIADEEVELGFDYVLIGHQESGVNVTLSVYDENNKLVANVPDIAIPLRRGQLTTVRGKFLTSKSAGDVAIDPSFDGEFNVPVN